MWWLVACGSVDPTPSEVDPVCNRGSCDRLLPDAPIVVAHNAMNNAEDGWRLPNQTLGYEGQVELGVRGFMLDAYDIDGVATLCHSDCTLGSELLAEGLSRLAALIDAHPDDVFVLVIQDALEPAMVADAVEAAGLLDDVITDIDPWPTLGELADAGTTLLVTHESGRTDGPDWYLPTYALAWDNDYAALSVQDFDCDVLRGDPANGVFLLNHFLTVFGPNPLLAAQANPREVLLDHVDRCEAETGRLVSWLAVDFVDIGEVFEVADALVGRR